MEEDFLNFSSNVEGRISLDLPKFIAVRHAESLANTQGIYQGQTYDTDLSPLGRKQAFVLAKRLSNFKVGKVITSPLKRAYQTAFEISKSTGSEIIVDQRLMETNHGIWEGKHKDWIIKNFKDLYDLWLSKPSVVTFPGGENFMDTFKRVQDFLSDGTLAKDSIVVSHDNIIRIMVLISKGETPEKIWEVPLESAALTFFEINKMNGKSKLNLLKANDTSHLDGLRSDLKKHAL